MITKHAWFKRDKQPNGFGYRYKLIPVSWEGCVVSAISIAVILGGVFTYGDPVNMHVVVGTIAACILVAILTSE
jgi:hypothetical protein